MLGITRQIHDKINNALRLDSKNKKPLYGSKTSCIQLSRKELPDFDCLKMITVISDAIESRAIENVERRERKPSTKNWGWQPRDEPDPNNTSEEVHLERKLIKLENWACQVPTSSGLVDEHLDKRRAIDLVHRCNDGWYEFIELKVASDTPLFAAMEILQYGLLYILSRTNRVDWGYTERQNPLLYAKGVHLKVLAPDKYYKNSKTGTRYELGWIEKKLNDGLKEFLSRRNADYGMTFSFESFTSRKDSPEDIAKNRTRVYEINS